MAPDLEPAHRRGRVGKLGQRLENVAQFARLNDFTARDPRDLLQNLGPGRPAQPFGRHALYEDRGFQRRVRLFADQGDLVGARLLGGVPAGENAPLITGGRQADDLGLARRGLDPSGDVAAARAARQPGP